MLPFPRNEPVGIQEEFRSIKHLWQDVYMMKQAYIRCLSEKACSPLTGIRRRWNLCTSLVFGSHLGLSSFGFCSRYKYDGYPKNIDRSTMTCDLTAIICVFDESSAWLIASCRSVRGLKETQCLISSWNSSHRRLVRRNPNIDFFLKAFFFLGRSRSGS